MHLPADGSVPAQLDLFTPTTPQEETALQGMRRLLAASSAADQAFDRVLVGEPEWWGHFTGSAWIVNAQRDRVVLVHHVKLGKWLQPGGHCEGEMDVREVAKREAQEETGLIILAPQEGIFDVDVHAIPQWRDIPAHWHYDLRYLFTADEASPLAVSHESHNVVWASLEQAEQLNAEESIVRMVRKTRE